MPERNLSAGFGAQLGNRDALARVADDEALGLEHGVGVADVGCRDTGAGGELADRWERHAGPEPIDRQFVENLVPDLEVEGQAAGLVDGEHGSPPPATVQVRQYCILCPPGGQRSRGSPAQRVRAPVLPGTARPSSGDGHRMRSPELSINGNDVRRRDTQVGASSASRPGPANTRCIPRPSATRIGRQYGETAEGSTTATTLASKFGGACTIYRPTTG
jgi:hypothetical protein